MGTQSEIQVRSRRYAALRSAQRMLGESLHPTELQQLLDQGRSIRARLQGLQAQAEGGPADPSGLQQVDRLLERLSADTRGMLHRLAPTEGRSLLRRLAREQPDLLRVLAEILLAGDLESDADLRMLEFLVTLLCCEHGSRKKQVVRSPVEAIPALEAARIEREDATGLAAVAAAEEAFAAATAELARHDDVGELRDRIRQYKRELGARILHPRVLAAAVAYNVAMANHVDGLLQDGRLREELSRDLLALGRDASVDPSDSLFDSEGFQRLVAALTSRVRGELPGDDAAARGLVAGCDPAQLTAGEREAFAAPEEESNAHLVRAAVALGLALSGVERADPALVELGMEPGRVSMAWRRELWRAMTAAAQELLADGRYAEAQRLSGVRARHLGEHRASLSPDRPVRPRGVAAPLSARLGAVPVASPLLRQTVLGLAVVVVLLLLAFWQFPGRQARMLESARLLALSPLLEQAYTSAGDGGVQRFVGTVGAGWERLPDAERQRAVALLGARVEAMGIDSVILVDDRNQIQGRYQDGEAVWVARSPWRAGDAAD